MPKKWLPERPAYRPERRRVSYLLFSVFALWFACRLCRDRLHLFAGTLWLSLFLEIVVLFLPPLFFVLLRRGDRQRALRLRLPLPSAAPLLLLGFISLCSGAALLSLLTGGFDTLGSVVSPYAAGNGGVLVRLGAFAVIGLLPALFEGFLFYGVTAAEYERRGMVRAVMLSALLFSLLHFDFSNLPAYLFFGALLAALFYATDSLPAVWLMHALTSAVLFFSHPYLSALYAYTGNVPLLLFLLTLVCLLSLAFFCRLAAGVYRERNAENLDDPRRAVPMNVQFYTLLDALSDPMILLCFGLAVAGFILF